MRGKGGVKTSNGYQQKIYLFLNSILSSKVYRLNLAQNTGNCFENCRKLNTENRWRAGPVVLLPRPAGSKGAPSSDELVKNALPGT